MARRRSRVSRGVAAAVVALVFAGVAFASVISSAVSTVFSAATLTAGAGGVASIRTDTLVVSDPARQDKPDQTLIELGGTTQGTAADSLFSTTVKALRDGKAVNIGADSILIRPTAPTSAGTEVSELRVVRWVADSLQFVTRNPKANTVTGAWLKVQQQRVRQ